MPPPFYKMSIPFAVLLCLLCLPQNLLSQTANLHLRLFYADLTGKFILQTKLRGEISSFPCQLELLAASSRRALRQKRGLIVFPAQEISSANDFPRTFEYSGLKLVYPTRVFFEVSLLCPGNAVLTSQIFAYDFSPFLKHGAQDAARFRAFVRHLAKHIDFGV